MSRLDFSLVGQFRSEAGMAEELGNKSLEFPVEEVCLVSAGEKKPSLEWESLAWSITSLFLV